MKNQFFLQTKASSIIGIVSIGIALWHGRSAGVLAVPVVPLKTGSAVHPVMPLPTTNYGPYDNLIPISRAFQTAEGEVLSTRRVNQITCRALQGSREWLGTLLGIKVVDSKTNSVRHYTRRDGLPGDYVEDITADATGVFCIVRVGVGAKRIALCALDVASGKWKTLREVEPLITLEGDTSSGVAPSWQRFRGHSRLAMSARLLLFAPGTVGPDNGAVLYVFDRATKTIRSIAWDPVLQADNPALGISFLGLESNHAYLGTTVGLCVIDLSPSTLGPDTTVWRRYLPTRIIDAGAITADGKTVWLTVRDRVQRNISSGKPDSWRLIALDTRTRQITTIPASGGPTPGTLTLGPEGGIWLSHRASPNAPRLFGSFSTEDRDQLDHYLPAIKYWQHLTFSGQEIVPNAPSTNRIGPPERPAGSNRVPDAAVIELAFDTSATQYGQDYGSFLRRPEVWVRARFPHWLCPEDRLPLVPSDGYFRDAADANGGWSSNGNSLVYHPDVRKNPADIVRYNYPDGTLPVRARVSELITRGDTVIVRTPSGLFQLKDDTAEWTTVYRSKDSDSFSSFSNRMAPVASDDTILLRIGRDAETLQRFDAGTGSLVNTNILVPSNSTLIGGNPRGAWFRTQRNTAAFVPFGTDEQPVGTVEEIDPTLPTDLVPPVPPFRNLVGATGDTIWYTGYLRHLETDRYAGSNNNTTGLIGYNRVQHRWTMPLPLDPAHSSQCTPHVGADGATYVAQDGGDVSVHRYDSVTDRWSDVAPSLPTLAQLGDKRSREMLTLITVGGREICLTDWKYLYRYDPKREKWSHEELPRSLQERNSSFPFQSHTGATKNGYWIGSAEGLWRFDISKQIWQERPVTLQLDAASKAADGPGDTIPPINLRIQAVDKHSVWGIIAPTHGEHSCYFRFDRVTHDFTSYTQPDGGSSDDYSRVLSDSDGLWIIRQDGTYRVDAKTRQATMVFRGNYYSASPQEEQIRKSIPVGTVATVREAPSDPEAAYLLLSSAGDDRYPRTTQPTLLYRWNKRTRALEPMPISPTVLTSVAERSTDGWNGARAPGIAGTGGLLVESGEDLWVGTTAGVFRVDRQTNTWRRVEVPLGTPWFFAMTITRAATGEILIQGDSEVFQVQTAEKVVSANR